MANGATIAIPNTQAPDEAAWARQQQEADQAVERARVSPFDMDFMLVLFLALFVDALDIVLELTSVLVVPKIIGIIIDTLTLGIGFWLKWRVGKVIDAKNHREQMTQQATQRLSQKAGKMGQQATSARNPIQRIWLRVFGTFLIELIPFVGLLPMWTITVLRTLRER